MLVCVSFDFMESIQNKECIITMVLNILSDPQFRLMENFLNLLLFKYNSFNDDGNFDQ